MKSALSCNRQTWRCNSRDAIVQLKQRYMICKIRHIDDMQPNVQVIFRYSLVLYFDNVSYNVNTGWQNGSHLAD